MTVRGQLPDLRRDCILFFPGFAEFRPTRRVRARASSLCIAYKYIYITYTRLVSLIFYLDSLYMLVSTPNPDSLIF